MIEKLISEHGSAEIMEKRLALMKEEAAIVERRCLDLQSSNSRLATELESARREIEQLRNAARQIPRAEILDESEVQILLNVVANSPGAAIARGIAHETTISLVRVEYYLKRLEEAGYVFGRHSRIEESSYQLDQRGREYLIDHNLV